MLTRTKMMVFALALLPLCACNPSVTIQGTVYDVAHQALPGVAVAVEGAEIEALTTGVGQYTLKTPPGSLSLVFMKSGYTEGHLALETAGKNSVQVNDAVLWPLPPGKGVFLFENYRYREATRAEPKRYVAKDSGPIIGTKIEPELETSTNTFMIISHKLPAYDLHLYRLDIHTAALAVTTSKNAKSDKKEDPYSEKIWAAVDNIPVVSTPVDEPERTLWEIRPAEALPPGAYAVHWGALDGHTTTCPYIYLFRIIAPGTEASVEETPAEPAAPETP